MSFSQATVTHGAPPGASDILTLTAGDVILTGWQRVQVTRALGSLPASFDIAVTEKYPASADVDIEPGQPCQVKIGGDLVITGYIDRYTASIASGEHTVRISGRSKSQDLVDCSALFDTQSGEPGMQMLNGTTLSIARRLAASYGIEVNSLAGEGAQVPRFNINLGETAWEIIDRVSRYSSLIAYDMPDGSVMLAQAGTESMASGFAIGSNVESASVTYSMDERFSDYEPHMLSTMVYGTDAGVNAPGVGKVIKDAGVSRFRKRYIVSEQASNGQSLASARAQWECNRRLGRSRAFNVTCDAWRDSAGQLWAPNHLAPFNAPILKLPNARWIIASVEYQRDERGQHAQLTLMDPIAFQPEPVADPVRPLVQQVENWNAAKPDNPKPPQQPPPMPKTIVV